MSKKLLHALIGFVIVVLILISFFKFLSLGNILSFTKILLVSAILYSLLFIVLMPLDHLDKKLILKTKIILILAVILLFLIVSFGLKRYASIPSKVNFTCSMYHEEKNFDKWWEENKYKYKNITKEEFKKFPFPTGIDKFNYYVKAKSQEIKVGDVISYYSVFSNKNVGHRIIKKWEANGSYFFEMLGDNNEYTEIINDSRVNGKLIENKFLAFFERDICKQV